MLDIKKIKENPDAVKAGLRAKEVDCDATVDRILELDGKIRALKTNTETQTAQKNKLAKENGKLFGMKKKAEKEGKDVSELDAAIAAYYVIGPAEAFSNLARFDGIRYGYQEEGCANLSDQSSLSRAHGFGAEAKRRQMLGAYLLSSGVYDKYYYAAQKARTLITQDYDAAYAKVDTILMPASPRTAFKFGEISDPTQMYLSDLYTISLNICGNGGISVPLGLGVDTQLPVSAQLVGPAFKDRQLLTFARALERGFADAATGAPALSVAPDFAGKGGEL